MPRKCFRRKKLRVVIRAKVKRRLLGMSASILAVIVLAGAGFYFAEPALDGIGRLVDAGKKKLTGWRIRSVRVSGVDRGLSEEILNLIHLEPGQPLSLEESGNIASDISSKFPFLAGTKVSRNWINGALVVKTSLRSAVGRVTRNGRQDGYLGKDGKIFRAPEGLFRDIIPVDILCGEKGELTPGWEALARFMSDIQLRKNFLPFKLSSVSYSSAGGECTLNLEDGSRILWGAYEFMEQKIIRLSQVLADADSRFPGPVSIDLRYFRDGKILLTGIEPSPLPDIYGRQTVPAPAG